MGNVIDCGAEPGASWKVTERQQMRTLKCVGGHYDGQTFKIADGQPSISIPLAVREETDMAWPRGITALNYITLTRRILSSSAQGKIEYVEYLAPAEMSDIDTFKHLLNRS